MSNNITLKLDQESVEALFFFSEQLPKIFENISNDTQKLINIYNSLCDTIGPHNEEFFDMLKSIELAKDIAGDSINVLSKNLKMSAESLSMFLTGEAGGGSVSLHKKDITIEYKNAADKRFSSEGTTETVKEIYNEYKSLIRICDYDCKEGNGFYSSLTGGISINAVADLNNSIGNMSFYFHEVGHMIDDHAGNGHSWLSSDPEFRKRIENDFNAKVENIMVETHRSRIESIGILTMQLYDSDKALVSDICGSLTECQCQGVWGHDVDYWKDNPTNVEKEAFANMFAVSIGSPVQLQNMKDYFPTAYEYFEYLIRSR